MYKLYQKPVITAFPDVNVPEPKISRFFLFLVTILSPAYLWFLFGFAKILLRGDKELFDAFSKSLAGKSRCIIAFRHADGREPQLLTWFFLFRLKKLALKNKIKFARRPHAVFVYGYEVARWGGPIARLFMPNLGAIPIHHAKMDSKGMARIYNTIHNGPYPIALAPEGQVSYSTDTVPRLEVGVVRIGFQAANQLIQTDPECPLEILPLSVHFRYDRFGKAEMYKLLKRVEGICSIPYSESKKLTFKERIIKCREYIIDINEKRYFIKSDESLSYEERLERITNTALENAERMLGLKSEGDFFMRLYKVRQDCWDMIFMPNEINLKKVGSVKRNVMNLKAGEAWHIARHQELADFGWYFKHPVPDEETQLHKKIEYVQNLWDFANRTMGGALANRVNIRPSKIIIKAAPVINLSERLESYKEDKKGTIAKTMEDLEKSYINCIEEINKTII